jgi:hypothetical protein
MSYSQPHLGLDLWGAATGLIGKSIDAAAGGPQQRRRARESAARTEDLRRQTAEAQAAAQTGTDALQQEAARRSAEIEAQAAADAAKSKKALAAKLGIGAVAVLGLGAVVWFVTRD